LELTRLSAHECRDKLERKEISSRELTRAVLDRIQAVDSRINAYITVMEEQALKRAAEIDDRRARGEALGPLAGIPVALKDNLCTRGVRTTCGSRMLERFVPPYTATSVEKLLAADAVLIGKTNMDEFAMGSSTETSYFKPVHNPWDLERVPGGSSGGSAAAVAADEAIVALGSDTGGSIRQPAGFCGTVGLKPTYGRVSRYGLVAYGSSLDQIGPLAKDVEDAALMLNAISGRDPLDATSADRPVPDYTRALTGEIRGMRVGLPKECFGEGLREDVRSAIEAASKQLERLGAEMVEVSLPHTGYGIAAYYLVATAEASSNLARYDGVVFGHRTARKVDHLVDMYMKSRAEGFGAEVQRRIMLGTFVLSAGFYDAYYLKGCKVRTLLRRDFDTAFEKVDTILMPTSPVPAFKIGEMSDDPLQMYLMDVFTVTLNMAGLPGVSIPCGFSREGLPVGMQFVGKVFDEETILRAAHAYEQSTEFHKKKPVL
jgi:aspartyl-tRNA(Asn)/glutamyl-tRNA(Gln) amidotransferase subunit A